MIVNFAVVLFLKQRCAVSAVSPLLRLWVSPSKAVAGSKLSPILRLCVGPLSLSRDDGWVGGWLWLGRGWGGGEVGKVGMLGWGWG